MKSGNAAQTAMECIDRREETDVTDDEKFHRAEVLKTMMGLIDRFKVSAASASPELQGAMRRHVSQGLVALISGNAEDIHRPADAEIVVGLDSEAAVMLMSAILGPQRATPTEFDVLESTPDLLPILVEFAGLGMIHPNWFDESGNLEVRELP